MKYFTYVIFLLLALSACKKGDLKLPVTAKPCTDTVQHDVVSVSGPTSAYINQQVIFNVTWKGFNACDSFTGFKQDTVANAIAVKAFAQQDSCSACALTTGNFKSAAYKFEASRPGTYYLKFFKSANMAVAVITDTLVVKE